MSRSVVVTGCGVVSSLGDSPSDLHDALTQGRSGFGPVTLFEAWGIDSPIVAEVPAFDPKVYLGDANLRPLDRICQLTTCAAHLALSASGWTSEMRAEQEVGLVLGTVFSGARTIGEFDHVGITKGPRFVKPLDFANTVLNAATGQASIWHQLRGINSMVATGSSSGLSAIAYAADLIRNGLASALVAGGAEELSLESLFGFQRAELLSSGGGEGAVPFGPARDGLVLGEGAGLLVLEEGGAAASRGADILAVIKGHASSFDIARGQCAERATSSMSRAIAQALEAAGLRPNELDFVSASAHGGRTADRCEGEAICQSLDESVPVTAIKSMLGETLGAGGPIQLIAALESLRTGVLPGIRGLHRVDEDIPLKSVSDRAREVGGRRALVNSFGLDGNSCAVVVERT